MDKIVSTGARWEHTPTAEIMIDVHLRDGVVSMSLPMLVEVIYPLIAARLDRELSVQVSGVVNIDGEAVVRASN